MGYKEQRCLSEKAAEHEEKCADYITDCLTNQNVVKPYFSQFMRAVLVRNALFQVVLGFYILKTLNFHAVKAGFILIYLFIFQCSAKIF